MIAGPRLVFLQLCADRGYSLEEVRPCIVSDDGDVVVVDENHPRYPRARDISAQRTAGPGTHLKRLLADWLGVMSDGACQCNSVAARMDALGVAWCRGPGMAEILSAMRDEHAKRKAARRLSLPWSEFVARRLVLLACAKSESEAVY